MHSYKAAIAACGLAILLSTTAVAKSTEALVDAASSNVTSSVNLLTLDVYRVNYFEYANSDGVYPSEPVAIVDPGTNGRANLCADIYVLTPDEQLNECCGCLITPDQLLQFDVDNDLVANPANGTYAHSGAIKIISSAVGAGNKCDPGHPTPTPTLRAWITHYNFVYFFNEPTPFAFATETQFSDPGLCPSELSFLARTCAAFEAALSGSGICSCPTVASD